MNKKMRGEPEGFWPRVRFWITGEYHYWDRVEVIERELMRLMSERAHANAVRDPDESASGGPTVTDMAKQIARALGGR